MRYCTDNPTDTRHPATAGDDRKKSLGLLLIAGFYPLLRQTLDYILPARCCLCGNDLDGSPDNQTKSASLDHIPPPPASSRVDICSKCDPWASGDVADRLLYRSSRQSEALEHETSYCRYCGESTPILNPLATCCFFCELTGLDFEMRSLWRYTPQLERLIKELKYHGRFQLAPYIGRQMAEAIISTDAVQGGFSRRRWDLIVPIPSSPERVRTRGFSHTALIARELAKRLGGEMSHKALQSRARREPQASLPLEQRAANVRSSFRVTADAVHSASILVIDDLLTTGATVREAARTLRAAGAGTVSVLTLARTYRFQELRVLAGRRRKVG